MSRRPHSTHSGSLFALPALLLILLGVSGPFVQNRDQTPLHFAGRIDTYQCTDGVEDGKWLRTWPSTGAKQYKGFCAGGVWNGEWRAWHESGELRWEVEAAGGLLTGRFKAWHDNGAKAAILDYDQGRRQGEYSAWTRDGVRIAVGQFVDDKPVGCWETYYENGEPSSKGAYQDGTKTGKWFYWDAQGNRRKEVTGPDAEDGCMWMW